VNTDQRSQHVSDQLHPLIHLAEAGLLIWFVVAAWLLFGESGYIELALTIISVLVFMAIAIPVALLRASRKSGGAGDAGNGAGSTSESVGTWLQGELSRGPVRKRVGLPPPRFCCPSPLWRLASRRWALSSN